MSFPKYYFSVEQIEENLPVVNPAKLANGEWGVWIDKDVFEELEQAPHVFCLVKAQTGKEWMVKVDLLVDATFTAGVKCPSTRVKREDLADWLEQHARHFQRVRADVDGDNISEASKVELRKELHAYEAAKAEFEQQQNGAPALEPQAAERDV